jgi:SRSO17 transposase
VSPSLANHDANLAIGYRLCLPEDWAKDDARRPKAKIPETIAFQTKPEITLEQIKAAQTAGLPRGVVLMDAGCGNDTSPRTEITAIGMSYLAGIGSNTSVWPRDAVVCRRGLDPGAADHRSGFNAMVSIGRPRSRRSPSAYGKRRGKRSLEGTADWLSSRCPAESAAGAS